MLLGIYIFCILPLLNLVWQGYEVKESILCSAGTSISCSKVASEEMLEGS